MIFVNQRLNNHGGGNNFWAAEEDADVVLLGLLEWQQKYSALRNRTCVGSVDVA